MSGTDSVPMFEYPWNGGTYAPTDVRIFAPDEPDEDGGTPGRWLIGLGDYCDEGTPDLTIELHASYDRQAVEWVAGALEDALNSEDVAQEAARAHGAGQ